MKTFTLLLYVPFSTALATKRASVSPETFASQITLSDLLEGTQRLQDFAYAYPQRNRVFGGAAHNDTLGYIYRELNATGAYDLHRQPQIHTWTKHNQSVTTAEGQSLIAHSMAHSPSTNVTAELALVPQLGCSADDYNASAVGKILLTRRGGCAFGHKSTLAAAANAAGLIIYNNVAGPLHGSLGSPNTTTPFAPTVGISLLDGQRLLRSITPNATSSNTTTPIPSPRLTLYIHTQSAPRLTYNLIAQTKAGNASNVITVGSHTDSVDAGPGINDNGSGTIGCLAIARALALSSSRPLIRNAVRFLFFTAEEFGLLGSTYYINNSSPANLTHIRLYLNLDMIASPNYAYMIYDGDGSRYNVSGPPGSDHIQHTLQEYFERRNVSYRATPFNGRSDYRAFIRKGIPAGGLFTGADGVKTQRDAELFGGRVGVAYDPHYHGAGDTVANLDQEAFLMNARAAAFAVARYAGYLEGIPERGGTSSMVEGFEGGGREVLRRSGDRGVEKVYMSESGSFQDVVVA
ncbi:putative aminopeptidase Y [Aspergillus brunneoviolaceus CBS 621.78]|uniref:Aminopeptidase Y n=1 Tax=Aspergillus brunneoviolaceus CBS 621.78 TaxID=1450534 RepID=A0ACD1GMC2_9EURO|nr:putative aminopeptidase Y [Aspergillus brunneoviolaceus CBS 621.78]RAH50504.1 putative aminopeptidase Y [Aspergillus brunneoviolaceus CBS 621.78]